MIYTFNGYDLNDEANGLKVLKSNLSKMAKQYTNSYKLVRSNGAKFTGSTVGEKPLTIEGYISKTTVADLQIKCDELVLKLSAKEKNLDITYAGATRRFVATLNNLVITQNGTYATWSAEFLCYEAFGKDTAATDLACKNAAVTTATYNSNETFGGTANAKPVITLDFAFIEPTWISKYLEFLNTSLSKRLRITRQWATFDKISFDCNARKVTLYPATRSVIDSCDVITGWTSSHTLSLEAVNMKEGVGALKGVMAGADAALTFSKLNFTPTIDLSSAVGTIFIPVFIPTPTSGTVASIDLLIGSDATLANNYCYYRKTTKWDGTALTANAWNWIAIDLSAAPTATTGAPNRALIKSIQVALNATATVQLNGAFVDVIAVFKTNPIGQSIDFEGNFPEYEAGAGIISLADEFTARKYTITTANYLKRYL